MNTPLYVRKDPVGNGAYLHDRFDKHLGYISDYRTAVKMVEVINANQ